MPEDALTPPLLAMLILAVLLAATSLTQSAPESRAEAAAVLERAGARLGSDPTQAAAVLEQAAAEVRRHLGPDSELADEVELQLRPTRALDADDLRRRQALIDDFVDDLRYMPRPSAELPPDFPSPTPVREIEVKSYPAGPVASVALSDATVPEAAQLLAESFEALGVRETAPTELVYIDQALLLRESSLGRYLPSGEFTITARSGPVIFEDREAREFLSIGVRGVADSAALNGARYRLNNWLREHRDWVSLGNPRLLSYSGPEVRGRDRFFEFEVPVKPAVRVVIDFSDSAEADRWRPVDDVVMGGVSQSGMQSTGEGTSVFTGELSLENNGGFASVRTDGDRCSLAGAESIVLRVRGDGKYYRLRCRTGVENDVPSYQATFSTLDGQWTEVTIPLQRFSLSWRGSRVAGPPLDPAEVRSIGLMIADKQAGLFRLELQSIATR